MKNREAGTKKRTTVMLPEDLWIEAKVRAARERKDTQDVLRDALEAWLRPGKGTGGKVR
jgi:hypothetical protein